MAQSNIYLSDVNTSYGNNTSPILVVNGTAVNNSYFNILNCPVGTMPWNRAFGSRVIYWLHEPFGASTASKLRASIIDSLTKWEPNSQVLESSSVVPDTANFLYVVTINYIITNTQQQSQLQVNAIPFTG